MKRTIGIILLLLIILAGIVWQRQQPTADDPLRAEKLELHRAEILRETEREKQKTEEQKRETARTLAAIDRQVRLESNAGVSWAGVARAFTWRMSFPILFFSGLIGAGVYVWRKPVLFEFEGVRAWLPRHTVPEVTQQALVTKQQAEMVKALAYAEGVTQERVKQIVETVKALKPGRENISINQSALPAAETQPQRAGNVPTFAALLDAGEIGEGRPLLVGFTADGAAQRRKLTDLKAVSIAGAQGSGKTQSMAYLITSLLVMDKQAEAFIIDPHRYHDEGLGMLVKPLEQTGRLHLLNPFDIEETIDALDARLDRRLQGQESSAAPVVFCVDELAKMGKTPVFSEKLLPFIERFTEESRKAGYLGLFCSQKWTARHFGNKADIRATIPSLLIHKTKESQADLLLEDNTHKKLVRKLTQPGQALMATSHDSDPSVITVPLITSQDVEHVAQILSKGAKFGAGALQDDSGNENGGEMNTETNEPENDSEGKIDNVIPFPKRDTSTQETQPTTELTQTNTTDNAGNTTDTTLLTVALESCGNDKKVLADRSGVSVSLIKEIQAGRRRITEDTRQKLARVIQNTETQEA